MFNKIYVKIKSFIKINYKELIGLILLVFLSFYELPYVIYTPGGVIPLEKRIEVVDGYKSEGSLNLSYVSLIKGKIPFVLASFVIPNWDLKDKNDITIDNGSVDDLLKLDKLYLDSSIDNATIVAYKKAGKDIEITKSINNIIYINKKADTNLKLYDELLEADGKTINDINDLREVIRGHNVGDTINLLVKRDNKKIECFAKVYEDAGNLLIGVAFLNTYEFNTDPDINIKTKGSEAGSSGGLMLSLAIYNTLVEEDITRGKKVVGTGTIDPNGLVGKIDGVKYKLLGASKKKADIFLCPDENYEEAIKVKEEFNLNIPIYAVTTFDEAIEILEK